MRTILLLHGALGSAEDFTPLLPHLTSIKTHAFDFRGHGKRSAVNLSFSMDTFVEDIHAEIEKTGEKEFDIFGFSMGGYAGLYYASKYPEQVRRIFTLGTKFIWTPESATKETRLLNADKILEKVPDFANALQQMHGENNWRDLLKNTADMMHGLGENNPADSFLPEIQQLVQVASGDHDHMVPPEESIHAFRALKLASLLILPGTPHPINKVNPARLGLEIMSFFNA